MDESMLREGGRSHANELPVYRIMGTKPKPTIQAILAQKPAGSSSQHHAQIISCCIIRNYTSTLIGMMMRWWTPCKQMNSLYIASWVQSRRHLLCTTK